MSLITAIGEEAKLAGYAMAGVRVLPAADAHSVREAWEAVPSDAGCVILTAAARGALGPRVDERSDLVWVVVPD